MSLLEADHWIFSTDGDPDFSAVFTVATKEGQFQAMSARKSAIPITYN
jgi:hypothetical protein